MKWPSVSRLPLLLTASTIGAWTLVGLLLAAQAWISGALRGDPVGWGRSAAVWLAWAYAWALLTPVALTLAARFPLRRPHAVRATLVHVAAGMLLAALNLALFALVAPAVGATSAGGGWMQTFLRLLGSTFLLNLPVYWLLAGAAQSMRAAREARERERNALHLEAQLADARLSALRSQLEPHFLFNALNTVSVLMHEDVQAADRVLVRLGELLRRTLELTSAEVALREELAIVDAYLAIERARFADRLSYRVDVDPALLDARVPSLILQPLVENAVRHGLARRARAGRITIEASRHDGMLRLCVRDDGPGLAADARDGIGWSNTRTRLRLLYGERHAFELSGAGEGGLAATVAIPLLMAAPA